MLPPQLLVSVLTVTNLGVGVSVSLPHGLTSGGEGVSPTLVFPDRTTSIIVTGVTPTTITFQNTGTGAETAKFRAERGWQPEVDAFTVAPMFWQGGPGAAQVAPLRPVADSAGVWSDYEEFEIETAGPLDKLVGASSLNLLHVPSALPTHHMVVRNGRIMRANRDYVLVSNALLLERTLSHGEVVVVYYNKAGV